MKGIYVSAKLKNVSKGHADVVVGGEVIGFVEFNQSARQWWGYDGEERRIGNWPSPKRDEAVRDVVRATFPHAA